MTDIEYSMNDCFISRQLRNLELTAVDILAGRGATIDRTEALLELGVVILILFIIGVGVIGIRIAVLALLSAGEQALQIIGHAGVAGLVHTLVVVDIVCHVTSSWFAWSISSYHGDGFSRCRRFARKRREAYLGTRPTIEGEGAVAGKAAGIRRLRSAHHVRAFQCTRGDSRPRNP